MRRLVEWFVFWFGWHPAGCPACSGLTIDHHAMHGVDMCRNCGHILRDYTARQ